MKSFSSFKEGVKAAWAASFFSLPSSSIFKEEESLCLHHPYCDRNSLISLLLSSLYEKRAAPLCPENVSIPELYQFYMLKGCTPSIPTYHLQFPWLMSDEAEYDEEEAYLSFLLFQKPPGWELKFLSASRYFQALLQIASQMPSQIQETRDSAHDLYRLFHSSWYQGIFSFDPRHFSLGALTFFQKKNPFSSSHDVQIRAFGPKHLAYSDMKGFGIGQGADFSTGWASCLGSLETWIQYQWEEKGEQIQLSMTSLGIHEEGLSFSLYVKTNLLEVSGEEIKLKSLLRYEGVVQLIILGSSIQVDAVGFSSMKIIPLSGEKSFWNTDFWINFAFPPHDTKCSLTFSPLLAK